MKHKILTLLFSVCLMFSATMQAEGIVCTMQYDPVCGQPVFECPKGADCMKPLPVTYSNKCVMTAVGAKYLYAGECKKGDETSIKACTREYVPVCGKKDGALKTYSNKCTLESAGATFQYSGKCKESQSTLPEPTDTKYYVGNTKTCQMIKYRCEDGWDYFSDAIGCGCKKIESENESDSGLSKETEEKIHTIINRFIDKLESKGYSDEKIRMTIDVLIIRLEELKKQEKYRKITLYIIHLLKDIKTDYDDDLDLIGDIFDEY